MGLQRRLWIQLASGPNSTRCRTNSTASRTAIAISMDQRLCRSQRGTARLLIGPFRNSE